jgi:predicted RNA-binding Zn ribbon-like protein
MSSVPAADPALNLAIAFLNTYDLLEDPPDRLTAARAAHIARHYGFTALADGLTNLAGVGIDRLRAVRGGLYEIFAATDPGTKLAAVNAAIDRAGLRPRAVLDASGRVRLTATRDIEPDSPIEALTVLTTAAIADAMTTGGPERFGTCAGDPCKCVYVDRTRAGRQRFCCQLCNDRTAAAAYRSRRAAV